ncbi:MAG: hypothetical protein ACLRWQ_16585 [Flavonifractor plautii]
MLDMGFIHDVKKILKWLPARKQTHALLCHHAAGDRRVWSTLSSAPLSGWRWTRSPPLWRLSGSRCTSWTRAIRPSCWPS